MNTFQGLEHLAALSDATTMAVDITAAEARKLLELRAYALSLGLETAAAVRQALKLAADVNALCERALSDNDGTGASLGLAVSGNGESWGLYMGGGRVSGGPKVSPQWAIAAAADWVREQSA